MKRLTTFAMSIVALSVAGSAWAGSTIVNGYGGNGAAPVGNVLGGKAGTHVGTTVQSTGTLPFTGLNLLGIALVALLLVGLGIAMTRSSRRNNTQA
jgi:hypothetical protein